MFLLRYSSILIFLSISAVLSTVIFVLSFLLSAKDSDSEKLTAYECGFNPFEDNRNEFEIRFYVVAILFLIFDLEISFLFPFILAIDIVNDVALHAMLVFLIVLTVGFLYE